MRAQLSESPRKLFTAVNLRSVNAQNEAWKAMPRCDAKRGFVLLLRRWVVERSFGWAARFRRLAGDYERLARSLEGFHWLAFISLMLKALIT